MEREEGVGGEKGEKECNLMREREREVSRQRERFDANKMIFNINIIIF